jgi:hypothetical protein
MVSCDDHEKEEGDRPYTFPDCLSERVRYMRVAPIDLSFDLIKPSVMKVAVSLEASACLRAKH